MRIRRRAVVIIVTLSASTFAGFTVAQNVTGGFRGFWGSEYAPLTSTDQAISLAPSAVSSPTATAIAESERRSRPAPHDPRGRLVHWNKIAIDASGVDHTPVARGEKRVFGEQLGPGRSSRAMAIVHIAIFDAVNAIFNEWQSYADFEAAPAGASVDAAIAQAAHDTLASLYPSQGDSFKDALKEELDRISDSGKETGRRVGQQAAAAILAARRNAGSDRPEQRLGIEFVTSNAPGMWRQDPVSQLPLALGAYWGGVKPFVIESGQQFRAPAPPAIDTRAYSKAFVDVKSLGGDGR